MLRTLGAVSLAGCIAATLAGCIGGGDKPPEPDNYTPKYKAGTPPPPGKKGMGAPSAAPPMGDTSTNPSGYIPSKK